MPYTKTKYIISMLAFTNKWQRIKENVMYYTNKNVNNG